jgi:hypothetical protein
MPRVTAPTLDSTYILVKEFKPLEEWWVVLFVNERELNVRFLKGVVALFHFCKPFTFHLYLSKV